MCVSGPAERECGQFGYLHANTGFPRHRNPRSPGFPKKFRLSNSPRLGSNIRFLPSPDFLLVACYRREGVRVSKSLCVSKSTTPCRGVFDRDGRAASGGALAP
mmetsp:Transcript_26969/g.22656  ORF Transcript_26969/g.22656 Transcript_26969/m.22656 type:complete len:103 (+) Transcript_26969:1369-1677(+)